MGMEDIEGTNPPEGARDVVIEQAEVTVGDDALRRRLGKSAAIAMDEELRDLRATIASWTADADDSPTAEGEKLTAGRLWHLLLQNAAMPRLERLAFMLTAIDAGHVIAGERDELKRMVEAQQFQISARDERMHNLEMIVAGLRGQVEAYQHMIAIGSAGQVELLERLATSTVITGAQTAERWLEDIEDEMPVRREEPAVVEKIEQQLKAAGIDTRAACRHGWEGVATDECDGGVHECQLTNPLHLGDHACHELCGATLSQEAAEKIEEAKTRADSNG